MTAQRLSLRVLSLSLLAALVLLTLVAAIPVYAQPPDEYHVYLPTIQVAPPPPAGSLEVTASVSFACSGTAAASTETFPWTVAGDYRRLRYLLTFADLAGKSMQIVFISDGEKFPSDPIPITSSPQTIGASFSNNSTGECDLLFKQQYGVQVLVEGADWGTYDVVIQ